MRKIRVAFLIDTIGEHFGGTETQLVMLLEHINRELFSPYLCVLKDSPWLRGHRSLCPQYHVGFDSFYSPGSWFQLARFARFLRREHIDILQTHFRDSNIVGTLAAKLAGVPALVATRRNMGYWHNRLELAVLRVLNPAASCFVVNSKAIERHVRKVEGVPARKIEVIYNGIDADEFGGDGTGVRRAVRSEIGCEPEAPLIVMVANLRPVKGIDVFVESVRQIAQAYPGLRCIIAGEGEERGRLQAWVESRGLAEVITFLGNRNDVRRLLMAADIGVLSSHSEGLSNAVIEYMAAGLPVVCTDVGGNRELVEDGVNGHVVPVGDSASMANALATLLSDLPRAREMGRLGRIRALDLFDMRRCIERTEALYQRLSNSHVPSRIRELQNQ